MRPRAILRPYVGLAFAVVAFSASLVWGVHRLTLLQDAQFANESSGSWFATQAEVEYLRFLGALDRYGAGEAEPSRDALLLRFDIFWSRLPPLVKGEESNRSISGPSNGLATRLRARSRRWRGSSPNCLRWNAATGSASRPSGPRSKVSALSSTD